MSPDIAECPLRGKIAQGENHCSKSQRCIFILWPMWLKQRNITKEKKGLVFWCKEMFGILQELKYFMSSQETEV
jgi:hypothetical protein